MSTLRRKHEKKIEIFTQLGLTVNQARIYLALTKLTTATVPQISKVSGIAREEIYRTMVRLQELSLVEVIIGIPTRYEATPLQEGINFLLKRKTEENNKLVKETKHLLMALGSNQEKLVAHEKNFKFTLLPKHEMHIKKRKRAILNAKKTVDIVTSYARMNQASRLKLVESADSVLKKGVKIRISIRMPESEKEKAILKRYENSSRELGFCLNEPPVYAIICDDENAFICTEPDIDLRKEICLWTNNPCLVKIAKVYFEAFWSQSQKIVPAEEYSTFNKLISS